ncbi:hypothetical protein KUV26_21830 [Leisingera daeponensis]|uniref:Uncharacterized protein n=1 Tax=Leisingera daeponensis TaxID=405746 RepID=A0ABS7NLL8_9RHOB|nr:hypothetical protein [Leisingera daeponensis]MBY6142083.1 hypothetical protein [Leisingera daeponensis]
MQSLGFGELGGDFMLHEHERSRPSPQVQPPTIIERKGCGAFRTYAFDAQKSAFGMLAVKPLYFTNRTAPLAHELCCGDNGDDFQSES